MRYQKYRKLESDVVKLRSEVSRLSKLNEMGDREIFSSHSEIDRLEKVISAKDSAAELYSDIVGKTALIFMAIGAVSGFTIALLTIG